jgi:phosphohistidine phosphatase
VKLYFLRHAHAEDKHPDGDAARRLTDKGINSAQAVADLLKRLDVQPAYIFTSPRVRALFTAQIVGEALGKEPEIREAANFGFDLAGLNTLIAALADDIEVIIVGHEPTFSVTIGELTGGRLQMKKSGLARVDLHSRAPLRGELVWLIAPKILGALHD